MGKLQGRSGEHPAEGGREPFPRREGGGQAAPVDIEREVGDDADEVEATEAAAEEETVATPE